MCVRGVCAYCIFFFYQQNTAYEMAICDWRSDVCSSYLHRYPPRACNRPPSSSSVIALNRLAFQRMDKDSNIVLIGPMGAGKSALGRRIASHFGLHFVDTDALIEQRTGTSIPIIFDVEGEDGFRAREKAEIGRAHV